MITKKSDEAKKKCDFFRTKKVMHHKKMWYITLQWYIPDMRALRCARIIQAMEDHSKVDYGECLPVVEDHSKDLDNDGEIYTKVISTITADDPINDLLKLDRWTQSHSTHPSNFQHFHEPSNSKSIKTYVHEIGIEDNDFDADIFED
jgi:hypothetical protein